MNACIIFDFDGVIIDSTDVQREALLGSYEAVVVGIKTCLLVMNFFHIVGVR